jgi:hypothetical protein
MYESFLSLIGHLANWDTHHETEITKVAEKAELGWRGLNLVATATTNPSTFYLVSMNMVGLGSWRG